MLPYAAGGARPRAMAWLFCLFAAAAAAMEAKPLAPRPAPSPWAAEPPTAERLRSLHEMAPRVETRSADELLAASERRAPEVSIAAAFYNTQTGQTTTTTRATKTQKRKHQINSLAIAAAERELELMEKRGRATKTKAETNAKYGW